MSTKSKALIFSLLTVVVLTAGYLVVKPNLTPSPTTIEAVPATPKEERPAAAQAPQSTLQLERITLARQMYASALEEKTAAQRALDTIEQRVDELESQLDALEAQGEDLTQHQDKTQPVFQQLLADYQKAMQRLDSAENAAQESLSEIEELERQP